MSVTMLSIMLVLSNVAATGPSMLNHDRRWSDAAGVWAGPELAAAGEAPDEDTLQAKAAEGEIRSVLRSLRRIGEPAGRHRLRLCQPANVS